MSTYHLIRIGKLLATRVSVEGAGGRKILTLLVDTGSTYTIIPVEVLEAVGVSPAKSQEHIRIVTGSGFVIAPLVFLPRFSCLGKTVENFPVIGHTLPPAGRIDGLLGIDFLNLIRAKINVYSSTLEAGC